jgi:glycosyltransferase involved in cell wall biosynthesis
MKILVIGPHESPIIKRLVFNLKKKKHTVWLASHNAEHHEDIIDLGRLRNMTNFFEMRKIRRLVEELQPDVVHAHVVNHYGLMSLAQPKPLVVALWGSEVMLAPHSGHFLKKALFKLINNLVLRRANQCHTSAIHVAEEAYNQFSGAKSKTSVFYWGFPLNEPSENDALKIAKDLYREFSLMKNRRYIVFPRGLDEIYNPKVVIEIIQKLIEKIDDPKRIVVLKGFCQKNKEEEFKKNVDVDKLTFIDRILSSEELHFLYANTVVHVSIPSSDSLGGGVVEPSILGSFAILSNLPSYHEYALDNPSHVMSSFEPVEISNTADIILSLIDNKSKVSIQGNYSGESIINKIEAVYQNAIKNHR